MRALRVGLAFFLLSISPPINRPASAQIIGDASVGFAAERVLIIDGQSYVGMMWHMPGEQRHEQVLPALKSVLILRDGSEVGKMILPQLHTVVEFSLPKEFSLLSDRDLLRNPVAQETVNGIATTKYAVENNSPSGRASGSLWLSHEGIPMKCDAKFEAGNGRISTIYWELRLVKIGEQDPVLFEIPPGYAKLPPEAAAPLLGIRLARPHPR